MDKKNVLCGDGTLSSSWMNYTPLGVPVVVKMSNSGDQERNMIVDEIDSHLLVGRVILNKCVIFKSLPGNRGMSVFVGSRDEAAQEGVVVFEECSVATKSRTRFRADHVDMVEDNWRKFLGSSVVNTEGKIVSLDELGKELPRFIHLISMVKQTEGSETKTINFTPSIPSDKAALETETSVGKTVEFPLIGGVNSNDPQ